MVAEAANCTVTLMRGTVPDDYGDVSDAGIPYLTGVPAVLIETSRNVFDPATQAPRTVRAATLKLPAYVAVDNTDQVQDEATGNLYAIEDITQPPTLMGAPVDLTLTLRRITAAGV